MTLTPCPYLSSKSVSFSRFVDRCAFTGVFLGEEEHTADPVATTGSLRTRGRGMFHGTISVG